MFKANNVWDFGFFKKLSKNDTGHENHQAGPLINIEIQDFFPPILAKPTKLKPAVSIPLTAELWNGAAFLSKVPVRYQIQSWPTKIKKNGEFKQEKRITRNMNDLLDSAAENDYLVMQRRKDSATEYRLTLINKSNPLFKKLRVLTKDARVGPIYTNAPPESFKEELLIALNVEKTTEEQEFHPIEKNLGKLQTTITKYCRDKAFRARILEIYNYKCAACGKGLSCPTGLKEIEAAHIIPRSFAGANDARNGIAFCKAHHWAFDQGLFWIDENREIYVPQAVRDIKENLDIKTLHRRKLATPTIEKLEPDTRALEWHRENLGYGFRNEI